MTASTGTTTFVLVVLLVAVGVAMIMTTVWLVRTTRTDAPALGPLEVMSARRWTLADPDRRSAGLDSARPPGAVTPAPMVPFDERGPDADGAATEPAAADDDRGSGVDPTAPAIVDGTVAIEPPANPDADADSDVAADLDSNVGGDVAVDAPSDDIAWPDRPRPDLEAALEQPRSELEAELDQPGPELEAELDQLDGAVRVDSTVPSPESS